MAVILHEDQNTLSIISRYVLPIMKNISDKICRETPNTHFMFNNFFLEKKKSCRLCNNVEKYTRAGQGIDDNMAHAH